MTGSRRMWWLPTLLVVLALACSISPASRPSGGSASGDVIFQDDFSSSSSGWDTVRSDEGMTDYEDGAYRIVVSKAQSDYWANPGLDLTDVRVEVDATKGGGPDDNDFGIICRYQDTKNFYAFFISSDGFYAIAKIVDGEYTLLGLDSMAESDKINQGGATNSVRADCVGTKLTLYVNGDQLYSVDDDTYASGDVGLIAGTFDTAGTDMRFDNFAVYKP